MAKLTLSTIGSRYGSIDALNANFDAIEAALENTMSLDGTAPNGMEVDLDMNSHKVINLADPTNNGDAVSKGWLLEQEGNAAASADAAAASASAAENSAIAAAASAAASTSAGGFATAAAASADTATTQAGIATTQASNASTSASNASTSASNASTSATNASNAQASAEAARDATLAAYDSFDDRYLGTKTSDPALDNDGNALLAGALYFNSVSGVMLLYTGSAWVAAYVSGTGFVTQSSATGSAYMPAGTTGERDGSPSAGYLRFNSTLAKFEGYNGSAWSSVGGGATGGGSDDIFIENGQTVTTNYTITTNKNAMSTGPISINSGITVTVPSGSNWVVL
jgi:hypothetical protein